MEELLEILNDINPDVDYSKEKNLIDGKVYDSFSIITLVSIFPKNLILKSDRNIWYLKTLTVLRQCGK